MEAGSGPMEGREVSGNARAFVNDATDPHSSEASQQATKSHTYKL